MFEFELFEVVKSYNVIARLLFPIKSSLFASFKYSFILLFSFFEKLFEKEYPSFIL
jgi:hypothetical protein